MSSDYHWPAGRCGVCKMLLYAEIPDAKRDERGDDKDDEGQIVLLKVDQLGQD